MLFVMNPVHYHIAKVNMGSYLKITIEMYKLCSVKLAEINKL